MNATQARKHLAGYLDKILKMEIKKVVFAYDKPVSSINETFISRIIIPLAGKQELFYAAKNKVKTHSLVPGEVFFSVQNGWAWITENGKNIPFEIISIIFRPEYIRIIHVENDSTRIVSKPDLYCHIPPNNNVALFINQALNELAHAQGKRLPQIKALLVSLLHEILFELKNRKKTNISKAQSTFQLIVEYINENYHLPINRASVANDLHLAPSYISRLFHKKASENFSLYLKKLRLSRARYRLKHSSENISVIARQFGFTSASYFVKSFKAFYGITPTEYRLKKSD
jgi:AraC-like DNA-binding protein